MATASWCYRVVPKVLFLEVPDDIRQRCSERRKGLAERTKIEARKHLCADCERGSFPHRAERDYENSSRSRIRSARGDRSRRRFPPPGGAVGLAAAGMLRREGYEGPLTIINANDSASFDRPNLPKDFLAGNAPEGWAPLRPPDYYRERRNNLIFWRRVSSLDVKQRWVQLNNGKPHEFGALGENADTLLTSTSACPLAEPTLPERSQ